MAVSLNTTRRGVMGSVAASLAALSIIPANSAALSTPDAELIRLGKELNKVWANERSVVASFAGDTSHEADERCEAVWDATADIVMQIEKMRATTLAGLKAKALALSWYLSSAPIDDEIVQKQEPSDTRLTFSVVRDLLAMGDAA